MSAQTSQYIGIGVLTGLVLAGIYFIFLHPAGEVVTSSTAQGSSTGVFSVKDDASTSAPVTSITSDSAQPPANTKEYRSTKYHFSLYYPNDLVEAEHPGAGGTMVVTFKNAASQQGFEIFIAPYSDSKITPERFAMDEPSGVMLEPSNILINGAAATKFFSSNSAMGDSREIWFLHQGFLFEVTTPKPLDSWLLGIMASWTFI